MSVPLSSHKSKVYQGDCLVILSKIPADALPVERKENALAYGEVTGHAHRIVSGKFQFLEANTKTYLRVLELVEIAHEEHKTVQLPPGDYQFGITQEYDYDAEESRRVAD